MTISLARRFLCGVAQSSSLPVSESLLRQSVPPVTMVSGELLDRRAKAKSHKTARKGLASLIRGKIVYSKSNDYHQGERWNFGEVLNEVTTRQTCWFDGIEPTKDPLRLRFRACNRQPLTQQAVSPVIQQRMPTSNSPVVPHPTPAETVSTTDFSVGATPSPVESPMQMSRYGRPIRPPWRLESYQ